MFPACYILFVIIIPLTIIRTIFVRRSFYFFLAGETEMKMFSFRIAYSGRTTMATIYFRIIGFGREYFITSRVFTPLFNMRFD